MTGEHRSEHPEGEGLPGNAAGEAQAAEAPAAEAPALQRDDLAGLSSDQLKEKVQEARADAQRNWQHFLHSAADLENYKKQAARERQDAVERTRRQMLGLVLGVLDNLERALAFGDGQDGPGKALVDGLRIAHRQILDQLAALGVRPIDAAGKAFDPRLHEAVSVVPPQAGQAGGTVVGEVRRGYLLNDEVLRPARVTVAAEPQGNGPSGRSGAGGFV